VSPASSSCYYVRGVYKCVARHGQQPRPTAQVKPPPPRGQPEVDPAGTRCRAGTYVCKSGVARSIARPFDLFRPPYICSGCMWRGIMPRTCMLPVRLNNTCMHACDPERGRRNKLFLTVVGTVTAGCRPGLLKRPQG
jgi:hypothetical protein